MSNYNNVEDFLYKFRLLPCDASNVKLLEKRGNHLKEELQEYVNAISSQDLHGTVDALVDLVYVALGTARMLGLRESQWNTCFDRVHDANMQKYVDDSDDSHKVGVKKPLGWQAPNFDDIMGELKNEGR